MLGNLFFIRFDDKKSQHYFRKKKFNFEKIHSTKNFPNENDHNETPSSFQKKSFLQKFKLLTQRKFEKNLDEIMLHIDPHLNPKKIN